MNRFIVAYDNNIALLDRIEFKLSNNKLEVYGYMSFEKILLHTFILECDLDEQILFKKSVFNRVLGAIKDESIVVFE